jgi:hypothetical protein
MSGTRIPQISNQLFLPMTSRPSTAAPILAVLVIVLVTLGAYVGAYFWLGVLEDATNEYPELGLGKSKPYLYRQYRYEWLVDAFRPAAKVESRLIDGHVQAVGPARMGDASYRRTFHAPNPWSP